MTARTTTAAAEQTGLGSVRRPRAPWGTGRGLRRPLGRLLAPFLRLAQQHGPSFAQQRSAAVDAPAVAIDPSPAAASLPPGLQELQELLKPRTYRGRFAAVYLLLAIVLATSTGGLVLATFGPGSRPASPWARWMPREGAAAGVIYSIARHVAAEYRPGARGTQLVDVLASAPPVVVNGTQKVAVADIAVRTATGAISTLDPASTVTYTLCGLGPGCSIDTGQTSVTRGRLLRREALELALYTFRFVPGVSTVVAFVPPATGQNPALCLLFQRSTFASRLERPLDATLRLGTLPPPPASPDRAEARSIDALTLPAIHVFHFTPLPTGGAILILDSLDSRQ